MGLLCFNPSLAFASLKKEKPRSIILTSGTLAPLDSFESDLKVDFKIKAEINHVIKSDQVKLMTLNSGIHHLFYFNFVRKGEE
jgi:Rad3-related DNA helicase